MFTGLVEETGKVTEVQENGEGKRITVSAEKTVEDTSQGDSINVSGVCLTVEKFSENSMSFFLAEETLEKTWFSEISEGDTLNLERSLKAGDRMGGHQVQGHVENYGKILEVEELGDADCSCGESACSSNSEKCCEGWNMTFELPEKLRSYVVEKGFVSVEGISLTTTEVSEESFSVTVIPETWKVTNLSEKSEGGFVNLESDPIGRYVEKIVDSGDY